MACNYNDDKDPSYIDFHKKGVVDRSQIQKEDSKKKTVEKIKAIILTQFKEEILAKDHELSKIERHIYQNKMMLDRLRAYVVASYYGSSENIIPVAKSASARKRKPKEKENSEKTNPGPLPIKKMFKDRSENIVDKDPYHLSICLKEKKSDVINVKDKIYKKDDPVFTNRFYVEKEIIVGNISKYLLADSRKENDKSTHKWMCYVRSSSDDEDISSFIKSVWFFLHPSYIPNDVIQINSPPFQLTRRGWGEFPIRVQLHFNDNRNKRFDVIHNLKLDKTYTGLQTLGAETIVKLELNRHSNDFSTLSSFKSSDSGSVSSSSFKFEEQPESDPSKKLTKLSVTKNFSSEALSSEKSSPNSFVTSTKVSPISFSTKSSPTLFDSSSKSDSFTRLKSQSALSSCRTTPASSRCTSPIRKMKNSQISDWETIAILHELIIDAPLFDRNRDIRINNFSCPSLEQYKSWSFSKRRASEWQRALFMKKLFIECINVDSKKIQVPTTKQIMLWCRRFGHVPAELNLKVFDFNNNKALFCHCCGIFVGSKNQSWCPMCMEKNFTTATIENITPFVTFVSDLQLKEDSLKKLDQLKDMSLSSDDFIDVTSTLDPMLDISKTEIELSSNLQLDWIYNTANQVDIHLPSVIIKSVKAPLLQIMLRTAMKMFASEIIRTANYIATENCKTSLDPVLVTSNHVAQALTLVQKFDFLTDAHFGKEENEVIKL